MTHNRLRWKCVCSGQKKIRRRQWWENCISTYIWRSDDHMNRLENVPQVSTQLLLATLEKYERFTFSREMIVPLIIMELSTGSLSIHKLCFWVANEHHACENILLVSGPATYMNRWNLLTRSQSHDTWWYDLQRLFGFYNSAIRVGNSDHCWLDAWKQTTASSTLQKNLTVYNASSTSFNFVWIPPKITRP